MSCVCSYCLDCGYIMNHIFATSCKWCGSINISIDFESEPKNE